MILSGVKDGKDRRKGCEVKNKTKFNALTL